MTTVFEIHPKWKDSKKYLWLLGVWQLGIPLSALVLTELTGNSLALWLGPLSLMVISPILEVIFGEDESNPPESAVKTLESDPYYFRAVVLSVLSLFVGFFVSIYYICTRDLSWVSYLALSLTVGSATGIAINTAHELGHKKSSLSTWLAKIALAPVAYGHFFVEHNRGHHVRAATYEDPATSRFGESFWHFLPRSVFGGIQSALELEKRRLKSRNLPVFSLHNEVFHSWLMTLVLWGGMSAFLGLKVIPFLLIQSIYGISILEVINYIEHYGLKRKKLPNGNYEICRPEHSWNSNTLASNVFLYQLPRHADHHAHAQRSFQTLRHFASSPQLPSGYGTMIVIAYCPPLWFMIMNPKVEAFYKQDAEKLEQQQKIAS